MSKPRVSNVIQTSKTRAPERHRIVQNEYREPPRSLLRNIENSRGQALEGHEGGISNLLRGERTSSGGGGGGGEDLCSNEHGRPCLLLPGQPLSLSLGKMKQGKESDDETKKRGK